MQLLVDLVNLVPAALGVAWAPTVRANFSELAWFTRTWAAKAGKALVVPGCETRLVWRPDDTRLWLQRLVAVVVGNRLALNNSRFDS